MLVLTRRVGEVVHAGRVGITICSVSGQRVRIGIDAPPHVNIVRGELLREPVDDMTFEQIVWATLQPGFREDPDAMFAALSAAISLLADAE